MRFSLLVLTLVSSSLQAQSSFPTEERTYRIDIEAEQGSGHCPRYFELVETNRYYEGGLEARATAWLQWMAEPFEISQYKSQKVVWRAKLKRTYAYCKGKASIGTVNGYPAEGLEHIQASFQNGYVDFIIDVSPYGSMAIVSKYKVKSKNPDYSWALAD
jgi:hypothetical protein